MDQTGTLRFPGNLDPTAQEFRPSYPLQPPPPITILPPHLYYPYPSPYPSLPYQLPSPPPPPLQPPVVPSATAAPTRTLILTSVPVDATRETIERELQQFGEVRGIQMERLQQQGVVTVHFYDLRHAEAALMEIREQHMQLQSRLREQYHNNDINNNNNSFFFMMRPFVQFPVPLCHGRGLIGGRTIWAQFMFPVDVPLVDAHNQGTIVVFNLDPRVSACQLKNIFEAFGAVKEVRETPMKRHQRFVEYFDIRDADRAIREMNGKEINGKKLLIEFSRPGGHRRFANNNNNQTTYQQPQPQPQTPPLPPPPPVLVPSRKYLRSISDASSSNSSKKSNCNSWKTNRKSIVDVQALVNSVCSVSLNGSGSGSASDKSSNSASSYSKNKKKTHHHQQQGRQPSTRNKSFKGGRQNKLFDSQFLIQEEAIVSESSCKRDPRTTVMIKNIPNKYSQKLLLNMLDKHCIHCNDQLVDGDDQPLSSYDFVYLPIDFNNKCNVGYGFVNMTSPEATWRLYKAFHRQHWEVFNSKKICEISYARLQGLEALKEHFKNSKFACETDEYLPVIFTPARNGKQQLTEPIAIGGHTNVTAIIKKAPVEQVVDYDDNDEWLHDGNGSHDQGDTGDDDEDQDENQNQNTLFEEPTDSSTFASPSSPPLQQPNGCLFSSQVN